MHGRLFLGYTGFTIVFWDLCPNKHTHIHSCLDLLDDQASMTRTTREVRELGGRRKEDPSEKLTKALKSVPEAFFFFYDLCPNKNTHIHSCLDLLDDQASNKGSFWKSFQS
jgi:hypothetical protein